MPKLDGFDCLEQIKKKWPNQKVIVCSGKTLLDFSAIQRVIALGADGVVSKSYQKDNIRKLDPDTFRTQLVPRILKMAKSPQFRSPKMIIKDDYCKEIIDGILIIHLLEKNLKFMDYEDGNIDLGFQNVCEIIELASSTSTPIFVDETIELFPNVPPIAESLKSIHKTIVHTMKDVDEESISMDWVHSGITSFLATNHIANLLVCGFNRSFCVANAASQLARFYGINVSIGIPLIFSHIDERFDKETKIQSDEIVDRFRHSYIIFDSMEDIKSALIANSKEKALRLKTKRELISS